MRLIDADALKESMRGEFIDSVEERIAIREIDEAPTIEPTEEFEWCHDCKEYDQDKHCCHRWSKQIHKTVAELEEYYKPKHGEWIISYMDDCGIRKTECSACGESFITYDVYGWKYCPWCGALMGEREGE